MTVRFNAPPGWPAPSASWTPSDDWMPDPSWPAPPADWEFWTLVDPRAEARAAGAPRAAAGPHDADPSAVAAPSRFGMLPGTTAATYGTDRGSWLAGLRAGAAVETPALTAEPGQKSSPRTGAKPGAKAVVDASWEIDGLLTSAGR